MGNLRSFILLAALTALFMTIGALLGGGAGAVIALLVAGAMNVMAFWKSDKAVLSMAGARFVTSATAPDYVAMVADLARRAGLPQPATYLIETDQPNAFATGRDPAHAAVAVTRGLLHALDRRELAAVIAHELAHIKHRDTLTMTITATLAGAISMLANFAMFFGGTNRERSGGFLGTIAVMIFAPMAAALVQMAISRAREYEADRLGAEICGDPAALASALQKIEALARARVNPAAERHPATAPLFIINPLMRNFRDNLFSTHPATQNRIAALLKMQPASAPFAQRPARAAQAHAPSQIPRSGHRRKTPWR